jgi:hypothetical protein
MGNTGKTAQLQIRVSAADKAAIQRAAARVGQDMSAYVLSRILSAPAREFGDRLAACAGPEPRYALAELNTLLSGLTATELRDAIAGPAPAGLSAFVANYVAAMVEYACAKRAVAVPTWVRDIAPLAEPAFGTTLKSLRLHLLTRSPLPFRRRNIFIDATLGDQA